MALYYGKQKSTPLIIKEVGNGTQAETTWAYHTGQAVEGDKVMLTKVNSLVTPDDAFCNGFRPNFILDGYAYGRADGGSAYTISKIRQIVNGVIDSTDTASVNLSGFGVNFSPHFCLNGTACMLQILQNNSFMNGNNTRFITNTTATSFDVSNRRVFHLENLSISTADNGSGVPQFFVYNQKSYSYAGRTTTSYSLAWEDGTPDCAYILHANNYFARHTLSTQTAEQITETPTVITNASQSIPSKSILIQTKDYKYLLYATGYIDVTLKDNMITINDYPPVIVNAIGDRVVRQMQVFYDGYFCFQLEDGVTLMCKYDNDMSDVHIDETVEPIYVEGDDKVYIRSYSADRLYWWQFPVFRNSTDEIMPLANNPAGPYKFKEASSDYMAFRPSKDRFNSTVLTGFLTGEEKFDSFGRKLVGIKTSLRDKS